MCAIDSARLIVRDRLSRDQLYDYTRSKKKSTINHARSIVRDPLCAINYAAIDFARSTVLYSAETKGHSAKSYRSLARKYGRIHSTIKECLDKMNIKQLAKKKSRSKSNGLAEKVIKLRLKLLSQNFFAAKSNYEMHHE
jgi:hypothetical protein